MKAKNYYIPALLFAILYSGHIMGQTSFYRKNIHIPELDGYQVLKCDLHIHTVFSDGSVWPDERIIEAWVEGMDAIAITDHIEYTPHTNYLKKDHNAPYESARETALKHDVILIKATEITKDIPGHFNALFIDDANLIENSDYRISLKSAAAQKAFITLNHPREAVGSNNTWWSKELEALHKEGLIHGIEIFNWNHYYPLAFDFCLNNNLTILGFTDVHSSTGMYYRQLKMNHRPMTLVLSKGRSAEGIREGLEKQRTLVYFKNSLYGKEEYLRKLINNSLKTGKITHINSSGEAFVTITNISDLPFVLLPADMTNQREEIIIDGMETVIFMLKSHEGADGYHLDYTAKNLYITSTENLKGRFVFQKADTH